MSKSTSIRSKKTPMIINRLAVVLKEEQKSSKWLAKEIGFTPSTLSKWMTNKKQPNVYILYQISLVLRRNLQDLFMATLTIEEAERTRHLKELAVMVSKAKRTGKSKRK